MTCGLALSAGGARTSMLTKKPFRVIIATRLRRFPFFYAVMAKRFILFLWLWLVVLVRQTESNWQIEKCPAKSPYKKSIYSLLECGDYYIMKKPDSYTDMMRWMYPGYLLNAEEKDTLRRTARCNSRYVLTKPLYAPRTVPSKRSTPVQISPTYHHGCCSSYAQYIFPTSAENTNGTTVEIVQESGMEQPLYTETCTWFAYTKQRQSRVHNRNIAMNAGLTDNSTSRWNVDETAITNVLKPSKILVSKGATQVTEMTGGEGRATVTVICDVNTDTYHRESRQSENCSGCQCMQPHPYIHQVVVYTSHDPDEYDVDYVKINGSCKCLNV